jgi:hypothetical protein
MKEAKQDNDFFCVPYCPTFSLRPYYLMGGKYKKITKKKSGVQQLLNK